MFRLRVLGGFAVEGPSGASAPGMPQRRAKAVLAVLAVCGDLGCTRERLLALLWPESDEAHARQGVRDDLLAIRHALGPDAVRSVGDLLHLDPAVVGSDVLAFTQALASGSPAEAVRAYAGSLLDGFHVDDAPEFERWLDGERSRLAREYAETLERLASAAERAGAWDEAVGWWGRAVEHDPLNTHLVLQHAQAMAAIGDRANAIKAADVHVRRLRKELDLEPDREVLAKIERIRRGEATAPRSGAPRVPPGARADRPKAAEEVRTDLQPPIKLSEGPTPTTPLTALARIPRWAKWAGGVALLAAALVGSRVLEPSRPNITVSDITPVTSELGEEFEPAISPDGKEIAYVAGPITATHLIIRSTANVAGGGEIRLADTSFTSEWGPAWSPDGEFVRFRACRKDGCAWYETSRLGGTVRPVKLPPRAGSVFAAWSPDGVRVACSSSDTIFIASTGDTTLLRVPVPSAQESEVHSLAWSPDGKLIAYVNGNAFWLSGAIAEASSIWIANADGGEPRRVTTDEHLNVSPTWLDARHLLFVSNRNGAPSVYVVEVGSQGSRGEPRDIPEVADPHSISYAIRARKLAYAKFTAHANIWAYPLGRSAAISIKDGRPVTSGSHVIGGSDVSPDGRSLAFDSDRRGNMDLYDLPLGGGDVVPLTALPEDESSPRWSPDGREIAFHAADPGFPGRSQIMVMRAEGGPPSALTSGPGRNSMPAWSPSGLQLAFQSMRTGSWRLWLLSRDSVGGAWHQAVRLTDFSCVPSVWAPDGSGVLCYDPYGRSLVVVSPEGRTLWRRDVGATYGLELYGLVRYSRDGRTIYAAAVPADGRRGVWAIPAAGGTPRLVIAFDDPALEIPVGGSLSVGTDHLYLTVAQYESNIWVANLR